MSFRNILRAVVWTSKNLDVIAIVAIAWVIIGYGYGHLLELQRWPIPYLFGYLGSAWTLASVLTLLHVIERD